MRRIWNISNKIARLNTKVITPYALYILIGLILYLLFNSYIHNSIIILALCVSLSLVSLRSSVYTNTVYKSAFHGTLPGSPYKIYPDGDTAIRTFRDISSKYSKILSILIKHKSELRNLDINHHNDNIINLEAIKVDFL